MTSHSLEPVVHVSGQVNCLVLPPFSILLPSAGITRPLQTLLLGKKTLQGLMERNRRGLGLFQKEKKSYQVCRVCYFPNYSRISHEPLHDVVSNETETRSISLIDLTPQGRTQENKEEVFPFHLFPSFLLLVLYFPCPGRGAEA